MATKFKVSSEHEKVFIDPNLLFQRLTAMKKNRKVSLEHLFKFELSPFPAALTKSPAEMHSSDKKNAPNIIVNSRTL